MAGSGERPDIPGMVKFAVLLAVVVGIIVVLALQAVPKAERPSMRTPVTVVTSP
jgi:hypothetical protein